MEATGISGGGSVGAPVSECGGAAEYEIRVAGVLDRRWAAWFNGLHVDHQGDQTVIRGPLTDQAALHGLLGQIRDLGLDLVAVRRLAAGEPEPVHPDHAP
jgi:hypothetical protein